MFRKEYLSMDRTTVEGEVRGGGRVRIEEDFSFVGLGSCVLGD